MTFGRSILTRLGNGLLLVLLLECGCRDRKSGDPGLVQFEAEAQYRLGHTKSLDANSPQTFQEAASHLRNAAESGHALAQYSLGMLIVNGRIPAQNGVEALTWIRKAAEQRVPDAEFVLCLLYEKGQFALRDQNEAGRWALRAAQDGQRDAQQAVGNMLVRGSNGMAKDEAEAVKWFLKAAEQGQIAAQEEMAARYFKGIGVAKNLDEALKWMEKAVVSGSPQAQFNFGSLWLEVKDPVRAAEWFRRSAEQGYTLAQSCLGKLLLTDGMPDDCAIEGYAWLTVAKRQFDDRLGKTPIREQTRARIATENPTEGAIQDSVNDLLERNSGKLTASQLREAWQRASQITADIQADPTKRRTALIP